MITCLKPQSKKIFINKQSLFLFISLSLLSACSGLEQSEQEKIREQNAKREYIYRRTNEHFYPIVLPKHHERDPYPWEIQKETEK